MPADSGKLHWEEFSLLEPSCVAPRALFYSEQNHLLMTSWIQHSHVHWFLIKIRLFIIFLLLSPTSVFKMSFQRVGEGESKWNCLPSKSEITYLSTFRNFLSISILLYPVTCVFKCIRKHIQRMNLLILLKKISYLS